MWKLFLIEIWIFYLEDSTDTIVYDLYYFGESMTHGIVWCHLCNDFIIVWWFLVSRGHLEAMLMYFVPTRSFCVVSYFDVILVFASLYTLNFTYLVPNDLVSNRFHLRLLWSMGTNIRVCHKYARHTCLSLCLVVLQRLWNALFGPCVPTKFISCKLVDLMLSEDMAHLLS
jgi:hypothetical protein